MLGLDDLCADGEALDLDAFNAPGGGFVVARNLPYVQQRFRDAFAQQSADEMETKLNAAGIPAARVRRLGEFLNFQAQVFAQGEASVRTPGLGFRYQTQAEPALQSAPGHGQDNTALLSELGLEASHIASLRDQGIIS